MCEFTATDADVVVSQTGGGGGVAGDGGGGEGGGGDGGGEGGGGEGGGGDGGNGGASPGEKAASSPQGHRRREEAAVQPQSNAARRGMTQFVFPLAVYGAALLRVCK